MKQRKITWIAEYTDTFGGQANYSWLRTVEFELPDTATSRQIVCKAKAKLNLTGVRCRTFDLGDSFELHPINSCTVVFIR